MNYIAVTACIIHDKNTYGTYYKQHMENIRKILVREDTKDSIVRVYYTDNSILIRKCKKSEVELEYWPVP